MAPENRNPATAGGGASDDDVLARTAPEVNKSGAPVKRGIVPRGALCRTFHYVRHHQIEAYERMGWMVVDTLADTPHGRYSVLMAMLCNCEVRVPEQKEAA